MIKLITINIQKCATYLLNYLLSKKLNNIKLKN